MSFLNPGLLALLAPLLALPLLIHLLNRRSSRPLPFPSVRHLKVSMTRSAAIYRWRHWLLLVLRSCLLACLLLAFLLPVLHRHGNVPEKTPRVVLVLIDHSLSMEHQAGGQKARQRAQAEAERILGTLRDGDRLNVVRVGDQPRAAFHQPGADLNRARDFIRETAAGVGRADFTQANRQFAALPLDDDTALDLYYLSDFQRSDWANVDFRPLPPAARVFFVDVGAGRRGNRALTDLNIEGELVAGGLVTVEGEVANFTPDAGEESVSLLLDGRRLGEQSLYLPPHSKARVSIPLVLPEPGKHLVELTIAHDALPLDDSFHAVVDLRDKEEILLMTGAEAPGADYLEAALNPYFGAAGSIRPRRVRSDALSPADLAPVTKLFITQSGPLDAATAGHLADFLFAGGNIVWHLDSPDTPAALAALGKALGEPGAALELGPWRESDRLSEARQVSRGDFDSPFLKLFAGTRRQDLGRLEVYDHFAAAQTGAGETLLSFSDGSPAMTVQTHGLGQLLLLNFSPDPRHANLANRRFFPVWTQSLVEAFRSNRTRPIHHQVGERITTEVWRDDVRDSRFLDPHGEPAEPDIEVMGTRAAVSFNAARPGVYKLTRHDQLRAAFAVNPPAEEADLRPIPLDSLPRRDGAPRQTALIDGSQVDFQTAALGRPVFHWFVGGALLCALLEMGLQLLIRKHAPAVVDAA